MTPKNRERDYEKRRYQEWQARQAARQARNRRNTGIVGVTLLVVLVVGVITLFLTRGNGDDATPAAAVTSPAASPEASPSVSASSTAKSTCPATNVAAQDSPQQFAKAPDQKAAEGKTWTWTLKTSCGTITAALDGKKAPQGVSSTIFLSKSNFYDGTICHRLTTQGIFVLQCGDPTGTGSGSPGYSYGPVENAPKGDVYPAGTIAMARQGGKGDSMGSQFFLVYKESTIPSDAAGGYTVLGKITKGLDVVQKIADGGVTGGGSDGAPVSAVAILSATVK